MPVPPKLSEIRDRIKESERLVVGDGIKRGLSLLAGGKQLLLMVPRMCPTPRGASV